MNQKQHKNYNQQVQVKHGRKQSMTRVFSGFATSLKTKSHALLLRGALIAVAALIVPSSAVVLLFAPQTAQAQTPNTTLNFQARILLASGALVPDGNYNLEFKIYDSTAAGASAQGVCSLNSSTDDCWWLETRTGANVVRVVNGYVSVNLGSVTAFGSSIPWSQDLYVVMRVGGIGTPSWDATEMVNATTGRMKISAVPLAFVANNVRTANRTSAASDNITIQTGTTTTSGNSGNITIDTGTAAGTAGTISVGTTTQSGLLLGRAGSQTTITGSSILLNSATMQRTAAGTTNLNLVDGSNTILSLTNSGAGNLNLTVDGTTTIAGNLTVDTNTLFVDASSNEVGIGTITPASILDIVASGTNSIRLTAGASWPLILQQDASSNFTINNDNNVRLTVLAGGNVGIGVTPTSKLHVSGTAPDVPFGGVSRHYGLLTSSTNPQADLVVDTEITPSSASTQVYKGIDIAIRSNSANVGSAEIRGLSSDAYIWGTGNVSSLRGVYTLAHNDSSGTVSNANGLYIGSASNLGTITNNYGLYVQSQTAGTNDYGIYVEGADTYALFVDAGTTRFDGVVELGNASSTSGDLRIYDTNGQYISIVAGDVAANRVVTIPVATGSDTFCLLTLANCGGGGSKFTDAGAYTYLTATTDRLIVGQSADVSTTKLAVVSTNSANNVSTFNTRATLDTTTASTRTFNTWLNTDIIPTAAVGANTNYSVLHLWTGVTSAGRLDTTTDIRKIDLYTEYNSSSADTIGSASNIYTSDVVNTNVTVSDFRNIFLNDPGGAGTITRNAALVVANQTKGTNNTNVLLGTTTIPTGNYSIYNSSNYTNLFQGSLVANNSATGTTRTTEATARTNVTLVTTTVAGFANNDIIFINNAGQDYYTRITAGGGTTGLTVSPAVSYDVSATVTLYQNIANIGATPTDYTTQTNRFFQGYFLGGVVTGAGSTTLSDGALNSTNNLVLQSTSGNVGIGTGNTAPSQKLQVSGSILSGTSVNVGASLPALRVAGGASNSSTNRPVAIKNETTDSDVRIFADANNFDNIGVYYRNSDDTLHYTYNGGTGAVGSTWTEYSNAGGALTTTSKMQFTLSSGDMQVGGVVRANGGFNNNGAAGASTTCTGGQIMQNQVTSGGIVTGGTCSSAGTGTVTGTGVANKVAYWSGASALTSTTNFAFDGTNLAVGAASPVAGRTISVTGPLSLAATANNRLQIVSSDNTTNLWNIDNSAGTLRIFRENYAASGTGAGGAVRLSITDAGTANFSGVVQVAGSTNTQALSVSGAIAATSWIGAGCEAGCESSGGYALMYADGAITTAGGGAATFGGEATASWFEAGYNCNVGNSVCASAWFRSSGDSGWYNASYATGMYSTGAGVVRTYNNSDLDVDGGDVYVRNAASGSQYLRLHHNGTSAYLDTGTGDMNFRTAAGGTLVLTLKAAGDSAFGNFVYANNGTTFGWTDTTVGASGDACYTAAFGYHYLRDCASSARYKHDIQTLTSMGLDTVRQMRPVTFTWNEAGTQDLGFIAEEAVAINPLLGVYNEDGSIQSFKYKQYTAVLNNAVNELDVQVQSQDTRLAVLEQGELSGNLHVALDTQLDGTLTVLGDTALTNLVVSGNTEVQNLTVNGKIITAGATPTIVLGAQATGQGAVSTVTGNDTAGTVTYEAGIQNLPTNPLVAGEQVHVDFVSAYSTQPRVNITPTTEAAALARYYVERTTTGFTIVFVDTPQSGMTYSYDYQILQ